MSHIAGDKYRAPRIATKNPGDVVRERANWVVEEFLLRSNGAIERPFLPLPIPFPHNVHLACEPLKLGCCSKTRCPCTVTETNTDCERRVKRD